MVVAGVAVSKVDGTVGIEIGNKSVKVRSVLSSKLEVLSGVT